MLLVNVVKMSSEPSTLHDPEHGGVQAMTWPGWLKLDLFILFSPLVTITYWLKFCLCQVSQAPSLKSHDSAITMIPINQFYPFPGTFVQLRLGFVLFIITSTQGLFKTRCRYADHSLTPTSYSYQYRSRTKRS